MTIHPKEQITCGSAWGHNQLKLVGVMQYSSSWSGKEVAHKLGQSVIGSGQKDG